MKKDEKEAWKKIGKLIFERRKVMGLTQTELGKKVWPELADNPAQTKIKRIESGQPIKSLWVAPLEQALELQPGSLQNRNGSSLRVKDGSGKYTTRNVQIPGELLEIAPELDRILEVIGGLAILGQEQYVKDILKEWVNKWAMSEKEKKDLDRSRA